VAGIFAVALAGSAYAQVTDSTHRGSSTRLLGVFDAQTGAPLPGVQVRDGFTGAYALTSETGTVRLGFLSYRGTAAVVQLMKIGFQPKTIVIDRADTASITEVLNQVPTLDPVITTAHFNIGRDPGRWDGFARRCEVRQVTCFREADFAGHPSDNIADLLLKAPGVTIGACSSDNSRSTQCGKAAMHTAVIPPSYCEPSIFVDGFWWNPHAGSAIDLTPHTAPVAPFTPTNVKGVEVYPTDLARPLRFEGDPTCGAIVIWTK
jgi:hypothetical protein